VDQLFALSPETAEQLKQLLGRNQKADVQPYAAESPTPEAIVEIIALLGTSPVRHWRAKLVQKVRLNEEWPLGSIEATVACLHSTSTTELEVGKEYKATRFGIAPNGGPLYWVDFGRETFDVVLPNTWRVQLPTGGSGSCTIVVDTTRTLRFQGYGLTVTELT
jgi:hypothetical protein